MMADRPAARPIAKLIVVDSVTRVGPGTTDAIVVSGSHGGLVAIEYASAAGVRALIVNDAGVGKDQAGIAGLEAADAWGLPVAAVDAATARIGDGADTYASGIISHVNVAAAGAGVQVGMTAREAATGLQRWRLSAGRYEARPKPDRRLVLFPSEPAVIGLDSASQIDSAAGDSIVVCGSHGGLVGGQPIRARVRAAFFNDAGVGKDEAGIQRLPALSAMGIPACAISHLSARIGDALDAYENGVLSRVNDDAASAGIHEGMTVATATQALVRRLSAPIRKERRT